jgi:putative mRNA 3-end processing factor
MSDHADWPGLQSAIKATGAGRVFVTHGQVHSMVRWLNEQGLDAQGFTTEYGEEAAEAETHLVPETVLSTETEGNAHMDINKATV